MESGGSSRSGLLSAGGVLSTLAGIFQIIGGVSLVAFSELGRPLVWQSLQSGPGLWSKDIGSLKLLSPLPRLGGWLPVIVGSIIIILGIIAIGGGVSAIRRRSFGLSLAGAICALPLVLSGWYLAVSGSAQMVHFVSLAMVICGLTSVTLGILAVIFVVLGKREFRTKV
jgi:hypothetical protein